MKRLLLIVMFFLSCQLAGLAKNGADLAENRFLIMSGYGYAYSSDHSSGGFGSAQTMLYMHSRHFGFGLDLGYSYTKGGYVNSVTGHSNAFVHDHLHNYFYIGPSVYWFPLNTVHHQIHIGTSVNYSYINDADLMTSYEPADNSEYSYFQQPLSNGVGFVASAGYTYKITGHIGVGARCFFSWFEQAHVFGLVNLCFEF